MSAFGSERQKNARGRYKRPTWANKSTMGSRFLTPRAMHTPGGAGAGSPRRTSIIIAFQLSTQPSSRKGQLRIASRSPGVVRSFLGHQKEVPNGCVRNIKSKFAIGPGNCPSPRSLLSGTDLEQALDGARCAGFASVPGRCLVLSVYWWRHKNPWSKSAVAIPADQ
jgi:hypothetical protein